MRHISKVRDKQIITSELYMYITSSVGVRLLGYGNRF